jgi:hypothetical protein
LQRIVSYPPLAEYVVRAVRQDMLDRGFALVKTPRCIGGFGPSRLNRSIALRSLARDDKFPALTRYGLWAESLIRNLLPEEHVCLTALELRHEAANHTDKQVDRLHADGSYIRSLYTLSGPSTVYRDRKTEQSVPAGNTIFMTAIGRARTMGVPCTLHRRPGRGMERTIIVCSFEPRFLTGSGVG